jgi:hypothetical protein
MTWREIGGPPLRGVPEHEGFGTTIVGNQYRFASIIAAFRFT